MKIPKNARCAHCNSKGNPRLGAIHKFLDTLAHTKCHSDYLDRTADPETLAAKRGEPWPPTKTERTMMTAADRIQAKLTESRLRLVKTHGEGDRVAKVYKDHDYEEYRVKHYKGGVHQASADYHTPDAEDAHATAQHWTASKNESSGFRSISKPSDLGSDAIGHNAYGLPGKSVSAMARARAYGKPGGPAAEKAKAKRGLGSLERGHRVEHPNRGKGTVHYVGSAPGMRGRPMASVLWDNPAQMALGPEPIFHGSGLAKGLRRLKESADEPRGMNAPCVDCDVEVRRGQRLPQHVGKRDIMVGQNLTGRPQPSEWGVCNEHGRKRFEKHGQFKEFFGAGARA